MPSTWTDLTVANATAGNAILATDIAAVFTNLNSVPRGYIGGNTAVTSNTTTSGTHTTIQDATGYSASVTYASSRILRVTLEVAPYIPGGTNSVSLTIVRGSTTIKQFDIPVEAIQGTISHGMTLTTTFAGPASGATETFKMQFRAVTNNTQIGVSASAANPGRLIVEDLGSA